MRIQTKEEYRIIENAVDEFCLKCSENTLEDESICEKCRIRAFIDSINPCTRMIIDGKSVYIYDGSAVRFTFNNGKSNEIIEYGISIIDATHVTITRLYDGKPSVKHSRDLHTLQLEEMIRTSAGTVELLQNGKAISLKEKTT